MGAPKALMDVGGTPWCRVQRERLDRLELPVTWVISPALFTQARTLGVLDAISPRLTSSPDAPMFESILSGVAHLFPVSAGAGGLFILPVDVPAPAPEVWRNLARAPHVGVPSFRGAHGHPVFLTWRWVESRLIPAAMSAAAAHRLDTLIAPDANLIEVDDPDIAVNLNTPDDVTQWLASRNL